MTRCGFQSSTSPAYSRCIALAIRHQHRTADHGRLAAHQVCNMCMPARTRCGVPRNSTWYFAPWHRETHLGGVLPLDCARLGGCSSCRCSLGPGPSPSATATAAAAACPRGCQPLSQVRQHRCEGGQQPLGLAAGRAMQRHGRHHVPQLQSGKHNRCCFPRSAFQVSAKPKQSRSKDAQPVRAAAGSIANRGRVPLICSAPATSRALAGRASPYMAVSCCHCYCSSELNLI
jgi:hypothetical protein